MGKALEVITGFVTAPGTTFTPWTLASGNSLTVRNAPIDSRVLFLQAWADNQVAGTLRVKSPRLHDNVQGIRMGIAATTVQPLLPYRFMQRLVPQDLLTVEQTGSGTGGDIESGSLLLWYDDLSGVQGRFTDPATLMARMKNIMTVENTLTLGTAGGYSGEEAIDAEFDQLKANTDYAILGYVVSADAVTVRWRSSDFGNLGVGGPGDTDGRDYTRNWFLELSKLYEMPLIPVFNSANKGATLVDGAQNENGTDTTLTTILAELEDGAVPLSA